VPCVLAVAITCVGAGRARRLASFYLATATLMLLGMLWTYWVGTYDIVWWLTNSADRTVTGIVFLSAVGLAHLAATLLDWPLVASKATSHGTRAKAAHVPESA
jgi:hypothetical protein